MNETYPQHNSDEAEPHKPNDDAPNSAEAPTAESSRETQPTPAPLIYVASLADQDAGRIHGAWLNAAREPDVIYNDIATMLAASAVPDAERFAIRDNEGFGLAHIDAADSIELVSKIARGIAEHGYAYAVWADVTESHPELLDHFTSAYAGHFASIADYAKYLTQSELDVDAALDRAIPANLRTYVTVNYQAMGWQLLDDGDVVAVAATGGGVWIFDERA